MGDLGVVVVAGAICAAPVAVKSLLDFNLVKTKFISAKARFDNGRHFVKPETICEMYDNTLPLLQQYLNQIASVYFVNVTKFEIGLIAFYDRIDNKLQVTDSNCSWFNEKVYPFINGL